METTQEFTASLAFTGDDDLYPTDITFTNGCRVRMVCSEDGKLYLRVERPAKGTVVLTH